MPKVNARDSFAVQETSNTIELHALAIAEPALHLLRDRSPFRVLNVFDRSANLLSLRGEVVSIITPGIDLAPFSIMVTCSNGEGSPLRTVLADDGEELRVKKCATELRIGRLRIATRSAERWNPQLADMSLCGLTLEEGLGSIDAVMKEHASCNSLWHILAEDDLSAVADRMRLAWRHLKSAIENKDPQQCCRGAQLAAGAGIGLTPAGDDFLLGYLVALWLAMPKPSPYVAQLLAGVGDRTGRLSLAWLHAAGRGQAGRSWHHLSGALARGDISSVQGASLHLLEGGHTSGADALTGFTMTLSALANRQQSIRPGRSSRV